MNYKILCLASFVAASTMASSVQAGDNQSVYTDALTKACKTLVEPDANEPGGDFIVLECKGYKGWKFTYKEGDLRASVHFGYLSKDALDNQFESFGQFNSVGDKIEWRLDSSGTPVAAIIRYFVDDNAGEGDGSAPKGQVLVVSKVGVTKNEDGCVVGYVDALANTNANELARKIADEKAADFTCGVDKAAFAGTKGPKAGGPTSSLETPQ